MLPPPQLVELVKACEGFRSRPYLCPAGYWTIGYGERCRRDHPPITEPEAAGRLRAVLLTDAGAMMILGVAIMTRGISYRDLGTVVLFHPLDVALPLWVDSALWTSVGVVLLVAAFVPQHVRLSDALGVLGDTTAEVDRPEQEHTRLEAVGVWWLPIFW